MSYDLRRLRAHRLITRIPRSHRYRLTDVGLHHAMLISQLHTRLLLPSLAHLTDPDPPTPTALRTAAATTAKPSINSPRRPALPHRTQTWLDLADFVGLSKLARTSAGANAAQPRLPAGAGDSDYTCVGRALSCGAERSGYCSMHSC